MAKPTSEHPVAHDPITQTIALLQPWIEYVPQQQRRLGLFIFLALLIHVATFLFIRLDSTRPEIRRTDRMHVTVDYPKALAVNGESADDLWGRLTDPRLYLLPLNPLEDLPSAAPTLDLNSRLGTDALPPPAAPEDYRAARPADAPLVQRVEETMRPPRQPFAYDEPPPAVAKSTTWTWDAALAALQPAGIPALPSPVSDTDLSPTVLRVAVGPRGEVEHVLVEQSSGEWGSPDAQDLDTLATLAAEKVRFQPTGRPGLVWGRMTVFWKYAGKPREEVVPTPPTAQ